jgi:hypothetical protein
VATTHEKQDKDNHVATTHIKQDKDNHVATTHIKQDKDNHVAATNKNQTMTIAWQQHMKNTGQRKSHGSNK